MRIFILPTVCFLLSSCILINRKYLHEFVTHRRTQIKIKTIALRCDSLQSLCLFRLQVFNQINYRKHNEQSVEFEYPKIVPELRIFGVGRRNSNIANIETIYTAAHGMIENNSIAIK